MQVVYGCCCGIDVHKKMIVACLNKGGKRELRQFGTMTSELKGLCDWLLENQCEMIAMESTGAYWSLLEPTGSLYTTYLKSRNCRPWSSTPPT